MAKNPKFSKTRAALDRVQARHAKVASLGAASRALENKKMALKQSGSGPNSPVQQNADKANNPKN